MEPAKKKKRKGNPVIILRVDPDMLAWIDEQVAKSEQTARGEPYDRSSFVRACITERKEKYRRAKEAQKRKTVGKTSQFRVAVNCPDWSNSESSLSIRRPGPLTVATP